MNIGIQASEIAEKRKRLGLLARWAAKAKLHLDGFAQAARKPALLTAATFFLSFAQCFYIPSPFAAAFIVAITANGESILWPAAGCGLAVLMRIIWGIPLDIWQYAGCCLLVATGRFWKEKGDLPLMLLTSLALLPRFLASGLTGMPGVLLLNGAALFIGAVAAPAFRQGIRVLIGGRHTLSLDDKLCCLLLLMALLAGTGYLEFFRVNLGQILAVSTVVCIAYATGTAAAVCAGLIAGAALAFGGQDPMLLAQLSLGGMLAGLSFGRGKRWEVCLLFLLADLLASFLIRSSLSSLHTGAAVLGCALFLFMGEGMLFRVKALLNAAQPVRSGMENAFASEQMRRWESAMDRMAQALPVAGFKKQTEDAEKLALVFCEHCTQAQSCWDEQFAQTTAMMKGVLEQAEQGEEALEKAVAGLRGCGCIRLHMLKESVEQVLLEKQEQKAREARARYEREMIRTHLSAMAQAVKRMAETVTGETVEEAKAAYEIGRVLRETGFPGKLSFARQVNGHLQAGIDGEALSLARWQPEKLVRALKEKGKISLQEAFCERGKLLLEEVPPFEVLTGSAAVCARETENGEHPVSGDAMIRESFPGGLMMIGLSDGMGHGEQARLESQKTLELLALCMAAGYTKEQAITAVNGMMLSATGGDRFATVDICLVDLWTGETQMEKLGACTSYLLRGEHVKAIAGATLPLGVLEQVMPIHQRARLGEGDLLVLLSDGVQDAYPDAAALERAIVRNAYSDPQRMADALLRSALLAAGGAPKDDMTVLVAAVLGAKGTPGPVQSTEDAV